MYGNELFEVFSRELFDYTVKVGLDGGEFFETFIAHDHIYGIKTKKDYIFDDAFWEIFESYPFYICHVAWLPAEEVYELRFGLKGVDKLLRDEFASEK